MPNIVYTIHLFFLTMGIFFSIYGVVLLKQLPEYRRRVGSGEILRGKPQPSFKGLRRAAIGLLVAGVLFMICWNFHLF
jgi:hypothetical protein